MGVAWVFESNRSVRAIERALEETGAERRGPFLVDSTPFKPSAAVSSGISNVFTLHHSHFPHSTFTMAPTVDGGAKSGPRAISDHGFDLILHKLAAGLQADGAGKFEVTGNEFALADFYIRVGATTMGSAINKGVVVEVEYAASDVAAQCLALLFELVDAVFPEARAAKLTPGPRALETGSFQPYTPIDTMHQYLDIFVQMRRRTDQ